MKSSKNISQQFLFLVMPLFLAACGGGGLAINAAPSTSDPATNILKKTSSGKTSADSPAAPAGSTDSESSAPAGAPSSQTQTITNDNSGIQVVPLLSSIEPSTDPQTEQTQDPPQTDQQPADPQTDQPTEPQTDQSPTEQTQTPVQTGQLSNGNIPLQSFMNSSGNDVQLTVSNNGQAVTFNADGTFSRTLCVSGCPTSGPQGTPRVRYEGGHYNGFYNEGAGWFANGPGRRTENIIAVEGRPDDGPGPLDDWSLSRFGADSYYYSLPTTVGDGHLLRGASHWHNTEVVTSYSRVPDPEGTADCLANPPCGPGDYRRTKQVQNPYVYTNSYKSGVNRWFVAAKRDSGDNNYRSFGYWLEYDMVADSAAARAAFWFAKPTNIEYRVFAAGSDSAPVSGLQGTATYQGVSAGIIQWNESGAGRVNTFENATTTFTANFNTMRLNGEVVLDPTPSDPGIAAWQWPDGSTVNGRDHLLKIAPAKVEFYNALINANGSFTSEWKPTERYTDGRWVGHLKEAHPGVFSRFNPGRTSTGGGRATGNCQNRNANPPCNNPWTEAGYNPGAAADQDLSSLHGQFYQPDGNNAPGSALGTFRISSGAGGYDVRGAFGTQKK